MVKLSVITKFVGQAMPAQPTCLVSSSSEARRLIKQGGVYLDGKRVDDENVEIPVQGEKLLKVGKRSF